jgi:hypothetical protein
MLFISDHLQTRRQLRYEPLLTKTPLSRAYGENKYQFSKRWQSAKHEQPGIIVVLPLSARLLFRRYIEATDEGCLKDAGYRQVQPVLPRTPWSENKTLGSKL